MVKRATFALWICALLVAASCGKKDKKEAKPKEEPKAEAPKAEEPKAEEPKAEGPPEDTVSVIVAHEVEDFDKWKENFDAHADARKAAGAIWHSVSRDVENENMVYVHVVGSDMAKMQEFLGSDDIKQAMAKGGVKGEPEVWVASDVQIDSPKGEVEGETFSIIVRHEVEDFDKWKPVFDADADNRKTNMGVLGGSVSRAADDPNMVIFHFMVPDAAKVAEAIGSDEMKKKMVEAGVKGAPEIRVGKDVETSSYQ